MHKLMSRTLRAVLYAGLGSLAVSQQSPPDQPFQAVHLIAATKADDEKKLATAMDDLNSAIAKGGCPACIYHLWKVYGQQAGPFNFLWISSWPGRDVYTKVHASTEYMDATRRHPEIGDAVNGQIYNRYVEVKTGN
jgi:hypothetical protein